MVPQGERDMQTIKTAILDVAFEAGGPRGGPPVILLHGWPDDIREWSAITLRSRLASVETIGTPTLMFQGDVDRCNPPLESQDQARRVGEAAMHPQPRYAPPWLNFVDAS